MPRTGSGGSHNAPEVHGGSSTFGELWIDQSESTEGFLEASKTSIVESFAQVGTRQSRKP